jgi:hypothetical protein
MSPRENEARAMSALFAARLRVETNPDDVAAFRNVVFRLANHDTTSLPTSGPVSHSP